MTADSTQTGSPTWTSGVARALALGVLIAAAVVYNQSAVHWRDNLSDSHYFAYCGWRVAHGATPYLDVWDNKPPGIWWLNALGFRLCGSGLAPELLLCSLAVITAIVGFILVARTLFHRSLWPVALAFGCVLLTHLRYECGGNRTETFVVPCEILTVLGYLRWRRGGQTGWLLFGGLFAGAAPLFKQSGLGALCACAVHLAYSQATHRRADPKNPDRRWWRPWLFTGGALATPLAFAAAALAARGALGEAWFAVVGFNRAYFAAEDAAWLRLSEAITLYLAQLAPLLGMYLLAGVGAFAAAWRRRKRSRQPGEAAPAEDGVGLVWLWLAVAFYLDCIGPGRQAYHLATTLAPVGLLALYPLHALVGDSELSRRIVARPSVAVVLALYLYVLAGAARDSVAEAQRGWMQKPNWCALERKRAEPYEVQAAEIRRITEPGETLYVWGWSPGTYRYAYRHSPSRFSTLEKLGHVGNAARFIYEGALRDIREAPPAVIAISVNDLRGLRQEPRSEFAKWLARRYRDRGNFEGMHILERLD